MPTVIDNIELDETNVEFNNASDFVKHTDRLVYLTGKVIQPGQHSLTTVDSKPLGVYEAIMISGGFARFADPRKSYVVRTSSTNGSKRRLSLDLQAIVEGRKPDMPIHPGDVVVVPEKVLGF